MSKMNQLSVVLEDSIEIVSDVMSAADKLKEAANKTLLVISALRETFGISEEPTEDEPEPPKKSAPKKKPPEPEPVSDEPQGNAYSKEEVRMYLAQIADKHRDEVKALLKKYGADHLSHLAPEHYAAIMADAEGIANG